MLHTIFLVIHITAGTGALVSGLIAMISRKRKGRHTQSGRVYFWCMNAVSVSAISMTLIKPNDFLMAVGFFSGYMNLTGFVAARLKSQPGPSRWKTVQLVLQLICLPAAIHMVYTGMKPLISGEAGMNVVSLVFGGILLWMITDDLVRKVRNTEQKKPRYVWIFLHIARMGGSYIAASTAFLVVNVQMQPVFVPWLAPTVVGTVLITIAITQKKIHYARLEKQKKELPAQG